MNDICIAHCKRDSPPGHVKRLGVGIKFNADFLGSRRLHKTDRCLIVKAQRAISKVADNANVILLSPFYQLDVKFLGCHGAGWVVGIVQIHKLCPLCRCFWNLIQVRQKVVFSQQWEGFKLNLA